MKQVTMVLAGLAMFGAGLTAGQGQPPAQSPPPAVLPTSTAAEVNTMYNNITGFITRSLAMVPADKMTWQPTPDVRTYARMFAHITDDNNGACAAMAGVTPNPPRVDTAAAPDGSWPANKLTKADIEKGLNDSIALCQKAFASVNQANMMESAGGRGTRTKIGALIYNTSHINEHYGNLVTYLRLNGMVPPSSSGK